MQIIKLLVYLLRTTFKIFFFFFGVELVEMQYHSLRRYTLIASIEIDGLES